MFVLELRTALARRSADFDTDNLAAACPSRLSSSCFKLTAMYVTEHFCDITEIKETKLVCDIIDVVKEVANLILTFNDLFQNHYLVSCLDIVIHSSLWISAGCTSRSATTSRINCTP